MRITRVAVITLLAAIGLAAGPFLAPSAHATAPVPDGPYPWMVLAGTCGLDVTVSGTTTYYNVINNDTINSLAVGTGTDTNGATYHFNYHNHASISAGPNGNFTYVSNDKFTLEGNGAANGMHVSVHFMVQGNVNTPMSTWRFVELDKGGGFACDPM